MSFDEVRGVMSENTVEYQHFVAHALQMARGAADVALRRHWLNIADEWTVLARAQVEIAGLQPIPKVRARSPKAR